jgi:hypothetical protein
MRYRSIEIEMERAKGIEPSYAAWEAAVLPLNYARKPSFVSAPAQHDFSAGQQAQYIKTATRQPLTWWQVSLNCQSFSVTFIG